MIFLKYLKTPLLRFQVLLLETRINNFKMFSKRTHMKRIILKMAFVRAYLINANKKSIFFWSSTKVHNESGNAISR